MKKNKGFVPVQVNVEETLHTAFKSKCVEEKTPMKDKILELMQEWVENGDRE